MKAWPMCLSVTVKRAWPYAPLTFICTCWLTEEKILILIQHRITFHLTVCIKHLTRVIGSRAGGTKPQTAGGTKPLNTRLSTFTTCYFCPTHRSQIGQLDRMTTRLSGRVCVYSSHCWYLGINLAHFALHAIWLLLMLPSLML